MGDRANAYVTGAGAGSVYLYTHWSGYELLGTVRSALARGQSRWADGPYLARIVFSEMTKNEEDDSTTGYGISSEMGDNGHPIIVIDAEHQVIGLAKEGEEQGGNLFAQQSFQEFVSGPGPLDEEWEK